MNSDMFGKIVSLNKLDYVVSLNEYNVITHNEYNNLKIIDKLGIHERLISLMSEIGNVLSYNNETYMITHGITHGGYIPVNLNHKFNNIHVFDNIEKNNSQLQYIENNIEYHTARNVNNVNSPIDTSKLESNLVIFRDIDYDKLNNITERNHDTEKMLMKYQQYKPIYILPSDYVDMYKFKDYNVYLLNNSDYSVFVPDVLQKRFHKHFEYYIEETDSINDFLLTYDNLIHFTMIVKNAGEKFEEVLTKNLPIIDRWTILDTGSTDNTIDIIKKVLVGKKKGELFQEPFVDFGTSRNRCLELAGNSCKYKLMLDDTYVTQGDLRDFLNTVRGDQFADSYSLYISSDDVQYCSNRITKTSSNLKYVYKIHEVIQMENNVNVCVPIEKSNIFDVRADYMEKRTMDRKDYDLKLLFEMVEELPNDPRHLYYIGQTYNLLKNYEKAFEYFMKRVEHPVEGNIQEKLDACFEASRLANFFLSKPWEECEKLYLRTFEMDKTRPEAMYFIGIHHYLNNNFYEAYMKMKKAFEIGYPVHCQYSLKPTLSFHFVPKFLSELCYRYGDYETGEKCCELFIEQRIMGTEYESTMKSWRDIFKILNIHQVRSIPLESTIPKKPVFCFLADGGFTQWSGSSIIKEGVGGSETYIIELSRYIQKSGKYDVIVFCNCQEEVFEDVQYKHINKFFEYTRNNEVEHCIISRYSEYIPYTIKSHVKNVYFVAHDLTPTGIVIPIDKKLKKIFCLSDWHVQHFTEIFPQLKDITVSFGYGIDKEMFESDTIYKKQYKFIYSSFPHRGLLALLYMWPRIINKYPSASLYIHCDVEGKWVNENATEHMTLLKKVLFDMMKEPKNNLYYMGWTSKEKLAQSWKSADVWLYPCIFQETFCLTALEAAISKTLVVTNDLAALKNTVSDRGVVIPIEGQLINNKWMDECLDKLFYTLDNREVRDKYVNKNYKWAKNLSWENRARDLIDIVKEYEKKEISITNKKENTEFIFSYINDTKIIFHKYNKDDNKWNMLKIGAFTGNCDNTINIVNDMKIILVEPVKKYIKELQHNYSKYNDKCTIKYIEKAISNSNGYTTIYYPETAKDIHYIEQCASLNKQHILDHEYKGEIIEQKVEKNTLNKLIRDNNIEHLDFLVIDTEGNDYEILMNCDFSIIRPKYIQFEYIHMDGFKTFGRNYNKLQEYLKENGYVFVSKNNFDCLFELKE